MRAIDQRLGRAKEGHFYERKVAINFSSNSIIRNCGKTCFLIVSTSFLFVLTSMYCFQVALLAKEDEIEADFEKQVSLPVCYNGWS